MQSKFDWGIFSEKTSKEYTYFENQVSDFSQITQFGSIAGINDFRPILYIGKGTTFKAWNTDNIQSGSSAFCLPIQERKLMNNTVFGKQLSFEFMIGIEGEEEGRNRG